MGIGSKATSFSPYRETIARELGVPSLLARSSLEPFQTRLIVDLRTQGHATQAGLPW